MCIWPSQVDKVFHCTTKEAAEAVAAAAATDTEARLAAAAAAPTNLTTGSASCTPAGQEDEVCSLRLVYLCSAHLRMTDVIGRDVEAVMDFCLMMVTMEEKAAVGWLQERWRGGRGHPMAGLFLAGLSACRN